MTVRSRGWKWKRRRPRRENPRSSHSLVRFLFREKSTLSSSRRTNTTTYVHMKVMVGVSVTIYHRSRDAAEFSIPSRRAQDIRRIQWWDEITTQQVCLISFSKWKTKRTHVARAEQTRTEEIVKRKFWLIVSFTESRLIFLNRCSTVWNLCDLQLFTLPFCFSTRVSWHHIPAIVSFKLQFSYNARTTFGAWHTSSLQMSARN